MEKDIRWIQRYDNFKKALQRLTSACEQTSRTDLEEEGLIQRFEYTYELAWKTLKDFLEYQGFQDLRSPTEVSRKAFEMSYIKDGLAWKKMTDGRNVASHEYNQSKVAILVNEIINHFLQLFFELDTLFEAEKAKINHE